MRTPLEPHPFQLAPWMTAALCRGVTGNLFFPVRGESPEPAKAICAICPVKADCLAHALANDEAGIWGGTSERERTRIRRTPRQRPYPANCGTDAGYQSHSYYGEEICEPCRLARCADDRRRRGAA